MEDQRSDFERLQDALEDLAPHAELPVLRTLGRVLRRADWDVTAVVCDDELIDVEPGDTTARRFAIAFDLGTTTVVATLLDLETGTPAAVRSMLNRQQPFGADVITRISATMMDEGALDTLQARAQETLAQLTEEVCAEARVDPGEVYEITLCGNVTMTQLALGIDPEPLSMAPFVVTTHAPPALAASDFGVPVHPRAPAFAFPSLGAYVGGDIVAGMLATGLTRDRRLRLFIDVGTNSEIALGNQDRVVATAAPAGPGVRGRADPLRDARRRRRDRGREDRRRRADARGDRRRRAGRHVRLGPRRLRRRARPRGTARPLRPLRDRRGRRGGRARRSPTG